MHQPGKPDSKTTSNLENETANDAHKDASTQIVSPIHDEGAKEDRHVTENLRLTSPFRRPVTCEKVGYFELLDSLCEGDIVLFRTKRALSRLQRLLVRSGFDHIGIVVKWESCSENCCSVKLKQSRKAAGFPPWHTLEASGTGVSLYRITPACFSAYKGVAFVRHVRFANRKIAAWYNKDCIRSLHEFTKQMHGRPYEKRFFELLRATNLFGSNNKEDLSSVFCSELVAAAYKRMGILKGNRTSNSYLPGDFSSQARTRRSLELIDGVSLAPEVMLDFSNLKEPDMGNRSGETVVTKAIQSELYSTDLKFTDLSLQDRKAATLMRSDPSETQFHSLVREESESTGLEKIGSSRNGPINPLSIKLAFDKDVDSLMEELRLLTLETRGSYGED